VRGVNKQHTCVYGEKGRIKSDRREFFFGDRALGYRGSKSERWGTCLTIKSEVRQKMVLDGHAKPITL